MTTTALREALESIDFDWPVQLSNSVLTIHFLPPHAIDKLLALFQTAIRTARIADLEWILGDKNIMPPDFEQIRERLATLTKKEASDENR